MSNLLPGTTVTIGNYLIKRLKEVGVDHIFGIPGDYVISFFSELEKSEIKTIGTCTEQGAAFAADAYSRLNGIGALCVTYCVGGLNTINAVAGAYAEKSPLVVISGAPGIAEYDGDFLLHHSIKGQDSQLNMFKEVTVSQTKLSDPHIAPYEIDRVIADCFEHKRPVYIELPRDMVNENCVVPPVRSEVPHPINPDVFEEALEETLEILKNAKNPVIMGGVEIRRYGLEAEFTEFIEKSGYPYVTTILGKSIIDEAHPQFAGVYIGNIGDENVQNLVDNSDCTIILGALMTDVNLGAAQLHTPKTIYVTADDLSIKHHHYKGIKLGEFIKKLTERIGEYKKETVITRPKSEEYKLSEETPMTINRFFERLNSFIPEESNVICDVGDSLFGSVDLKIPKNSSYLGPAFYTSMGFAVPAGLGAQIATPENRPIIVVGDGAFQMMVQEVSTFVTQGLNPIIFIMNNKGYTTQRFLKDGLYNDINNWNYHKLPELLGSGLGLEVKTEGDLEIVLEKAKDNTDSYTLVNVHLEKYDKSKTLYRLTSHFKKKV